MHCAGINEVREGHLVYASQSLIIRMSNDLQDQWMIDSNETVNRIIDDLSRNCHALGLLLILGLALLQNYNSWW
jgi:hypothetical protein